MKADRLFDVRNDVVVIICAASSIGLAIAKVLAANHASLVLFDIDKAALAATSDRLANPFGCQVRL